MCSSICECYTISVELCRTTCCLKDYLLPNLDGPSCWILIVLPLLPTAQLPFLHFSLLSPYCTCNMIVRADNCTSIEIIHIIRPLGLLSLTMSHFFRIKFKVSVTTLLLTFINFVQGLHLYSGQWLEVWLLVK